MKRLTALLSILAFLATPWVAGCAADGQTSTDATEEATPQPAVGTFDAVPLLGELTTGMLYSDIWERPQLSKRDRSLITVATLVALYRPEQLRVHLARALDNGVTKDEISELITHLAFYSGWPTAMSAAGLAKTVFEEQK